MIDGVPPPAYLTKAEFATARLRAALHSGRFKPGEHLPAAKVAAEMDLSVTPVREALFELAKEGLLVAAPHRGVRVAEFSPEHLREVFEVRAMLESHAAGRAAERMSAAQLKGLDSVQREIREAVRLGQVESLRGLNDYFHFMIYEAADGKLLGRLIKQAWGAAPHDIFHQIQQRAPQTVKDHDRILRALKARDPGASADAMAAHIMNSYRLQEALATSHAQSDAVGRAAPET